MRNRILMCGGETGETVEPDPEDVRGFDAYMEVYKKGLQVEAAAVESLLF